MRSVETDLSPSLDSGPQQLLRGLLARSIGGEDKGSGREHQARGHACAVQQHLLLRKFTRRSLIHIDSD